MRLLLIAPAILLLQGCFGDWNINTNDDYLEAQRSAFASQQDAWARAQEARAREVKPDTFMMTGAWSCADPDPDRCRIAVNLSGFVQEQRAPQPGVRVDEGTSVVKAVRDTVAGASPWVAGAVVLGKALENGGDRTTNIEGDDNTVSADEVRDYDLASGDSSRIGDDDHLTDVGNDKKTYADVGNDKQTYDNVGNNQPVDNRQNYENATAEPTIVEPSVHQIPVQVVRPEVVWGE